MPDTKLPFFKFFPADFLTDTMAMPVETRGVYITLLCYQWLNGSIPSDDVGIARICSITTAELQPHMEYLDEKFVNTTEHNRTRVNLRLERERQKAQAFRASRVRAGLASGASRSNTSRTKREHNRTIHSSDTYSEKHKPPAGTDHKHPFGDDEVKYPEGLNVDAWEKYVEHRRDIKAKKLTMKGSAQAMNKWAKTSPEAQMRAVEASIANGWTGCFPEKEMPGRGKETPLQKLSREMDEQNAHK